MRTPSTGTTGAGGAPEPAAVREQLDRILASREFHATGRMRDFLRFVVAETLDGRADQLKGYTIATQVFGRGGDFDAGQDPIVRIQAGRLRRALERYYLVGGVQDPIVIDMPKGRYVPTFARRPAPVPAPAANARREGPDAMPREPSVAVMPLEDLTPDADREFFAAGLAEELVTELNRYQDIVVVPCQRIGEAAGSPREMARICREVGARFLLGGTVRRDATAAKVTASLMDAKAGRQVWARSFKVSLEAAHLIATQEEIAGSVVAAVGSEQGVIVRRLAAESRKKRPAELSTYEAMLRYYTYMIAPSPGASRPCFEALGAAVEREPDYGPAWSALATLHCQMHVFDAPGFTDPLATGLAYAQRGVHLDPGRQLSRLILAYASLLSDAGEAFRAEAETTLALNPNNPYAVGTVGYMHVLAGDFAQGRRLLDQATTANPVHPRWFSNAYYLECFHRGDYEGALERVGAEDDTDLWRPLLLSAVLGKLGRGPDAADANAKLLAAKPDILVRARELVGRSVKTPDLVDSLLDGLRKAGLAVGDEGGPG